MSFFTHFDSSEEDLPAANAADESWSTSQHSNRSLGFFEDHSAPDIQSEDQKESYKGAPRKQFLSQLISFKRAKDNQVSERHENHDSGTRISLQPQPQPLPQPQPQPQPQPTESVDHNEAEFNSDGRRVRGNEMEHLTSSLQGQQIQPRTGLNVNDSLSDKESIVTRTETWQEVTCVRSIIPDEIEDVDSGTKLFDAKTTKDRPSLPAGFKRRSSSNRRQIWDEKELKIREIMSAIRRIKEDVNEIEIEDVSLLNSLAEAKRSLLEADFSRTKDEIDSYSSSLKKMRRAAEDLLDELRS